MKKISTISRLPKLFFAKNSLNSSSFTANQVLISRFYTAKGDTDAQKLRLGGIDASSLLGKRQFSTSSVAYKKSKGKKEAKEEKATDVTEEFDSKQFDKDLTAKFNESLEVFKKKASEVKSGKADTKLFNNLTIHLSHNETVKFTDVAQTTLKGRNLLITLFDPTVSKNVVSAVIGSGLNLNPQIDAKNPQLLKVPLPAPTSEHKNEIIKNLKVVFNTFKSSPSKYAINSIRAAALKDLKDVKGLSKDELKKFTQKVDTVTKDFTKKLSTELASIEKTV